MKRFIVLSIVILSCFQILFSQEYFLVAGDAVKVTVIAASNSTSYTSIVDGEGNLTLYREKYTGSEVTIFSKQLNNNANPAANMEAFAVIYAAGMSLDEAKTEIENIYSKLIKYTSIDVILDKSFLGVFLDYGKSIRRTDFVLGYRYLDYFMHSKNPLNFNSDSIYVRNESGIKKMSMTDTAQPNDVLLIKSDIVYVTGEVKNPSAINFNPGYSLFDYISLSGGISRTGTYGNIVLRGCDGKKKNVKSPLAPGDIIEVGPSFVSILKDFVSVATIVTSVLSVFYIYQAGVNIFN